MDNEQPEFRAWDDKRKKMLYEFNDKYEVSMDYGTLVVGSYDTDGDYYELELMQYTHQLNKEKKKVYAGDILQNDEGNLHVIGMRNGCFTNVKSKYKGNEWRDVHKQDTQFVFDHSITIGNIYENPELLQ